MPALKTLRQLVQDAFESEQLPWLERLVNQPSHSPAVADVEAAASLLDATAETLGLAVRKWPVPEQTHATHRIYSTPGNGPALALVGHVDTVFPRRLGFLKYRRDGQQIHGPGVLDMKSGLSACFFALKALKAFAPERFATLPVRLIVVSDEEVGSYTSRPLYEAVAPELAGALVFEAGRTGDLIVTRRKGSALFHVDAEGVAAHAGLHHADGVNAIHALALVIPAIEALTDYDRGVTFNVGLVEGGTAKNTVPDQARCSVDCRFETAADGEWAEDALRKLTESPPLPERLQSAKITLSGRISRPPMEATPASQALRLAYEKHAAAAGLKIGEAPLQGGGSDANLLAALGVPSIDGLGPYGRHFHRIDEWSDLDSLRARTEALATYLFEYAGNLPTT